VKYYDGILFTLCLLIAEIGGHAQDLDPRAYVRIPVNVTFLVTGFGYSHGGVVTDPTLPVQDLHAAIESPSLAVGHSFSLFGKTAQVSAALPYAWAQLSGVVTGSSQSTTRSGFSDARLRFSVLFLGAPAATINDLVKTERKTILGASLSIVTPTGQYLPEKMINLGTSRWSFKPELALSQPVGKRWLIDIYSAIWIFSKNDSFYPGSSVRTQDPMGSFQGHISYNIRPNMWAAINMTFYTGGRTSVDGSEKNDRQSNSRIGATVVLPVGKLNSVKMAISTGAIVRYGADFTSVSIGWQTFILRRQKETGS
jgi:hypothetical protein